MDEESATYSLLANATMGSQTLSTMGGLAVLGERRDALPRCGSLLASAPDELIESLEANDPDFAAHCLAD